MDNKYKNGKIYKLICDNSNLVYFGSTTRLLSERLSQHKSQGNASSSRELFVLGNVSIVLVEEYPCNSKYELESRERFYIESMLNNFEHRTICNKYIPTRTKAESSAEYHRNNRVQRNEKKRLKFNCECSGKYTYATKSRHMKSKKHITYLKNKDNA